eukprot:4005037-Ditylum_brightwellii.AAC.1
MAITIVHHLDPIHHLCNKASKAKMEDDNVHMAANSSMMHPPPAGYIPSSKGLCLTGEAVNGSNMAPTPV